LALLQIIVDVPALKVKPVALDIFTGVVPAHVTVEDPSAIERVVVPTVLIVPIATAKLPVLKAPPVTDIVPFPVYADPKVQAPPLPLNTKVKPPKLMLLVVIVCPVVTLLNAIEPPAVTLVATPVAEFVQEPEQFNSEVAAQVSVTFPDSGPAMVAFRQFAGVAVTPMVTA
jgi:hypothetical protein